MPHKRVDNGVSTFFFPVSQRCKSSDSNCGAVTLKHTDEFSNVLSLVSIHDDALAMFECPGGTTRFEYHRLTAQLEDTHLHRCTSAQARIKENQCHRFTS